MHRVPGNDLILGKLAGGKSVLGLSRRERDKHLYVCGGTGTGKSKFLENLIRQDIRNWRNSRCGMLVLDPHGSLYDNLTSWLTKLNVNLPIVPIDLRSDDWVVSYNLLRQRQTADPAVLVDNLVDAIAHVWGQGGTNHTPLMARWSGNVLRALYENGATLVDAEFLINQLDKQIRFAMTSDLSDKPSRQDWMFADKLSAKDFESQIGSTVNRLLRFIRNKTMRAMFGQPTLSLDLGKALSEGSIILVSLAKDRAKISKENAELFATLLLSDLWTAAQERGKRDDIKPFYVYMDEFQKFVTPTIAENLDEARGFGLHFTLAHQFPNQLLDRGESGRRVYNSIMETASSKVIFRLTDETNLIPMAKWLFRGTMDPDAIKHELYSTKVMAYREELRTSLSRGHGASRGGGEFTGTTDSVSRSGRVTEDEQLDPNGWGESFASSGGDSETWTESDSESQTTSSVLIPVMGKELSHVQFRSLDEQLHRAMAVLFDQQERHSVARMVGMKAPVSVVTPEVSNMPVSEQRIKRFLAMRYGKLEFALPSEQAHKVITDRAETFGEQLFQQTRQEPKTTRRKL